MTSEALKTRTDMIAERAEVPKTRRSGSCGISAPHGCRKNWICFENVFCVPKGMDLSVVKSGPNLG